MARGEIPLAVTRTVATVTGGTAPVAIAGASVSINTRSAAPAPATIYAAETGGTTLANPLTTTTDGRIDGWLEEGAYDLTISGSGITTYTQPLDIVSGKSILAFPGDRLVAGSVVGAALANSTVTGSKIASGTITPLNLANSVLPIGSVIQWWRPNGAYPLPSGWAVCDGSIISSSNHDFGTGGSITLPNMINRFAMGANPSAAYGQTGDGGSVGAGVNGSGGANFLALAHSHVADDHYHNAQGTVGSYAGNLYADDHLHSSGSLYAANHAHHFAVGTSAGNRGGPMQLGGSAEAGTFLNHWHWIETDTWGSQPGVGGSTGASDRWLYVRGNTSGSSHRGMTSALSTMDSRPLWVGLVYLMKIKAI